MANITEQFQLFVLLRGRSLYTNQQKERGIFSGIHENLNFELFKKIQNLAFVNCKDLAKNLKFLEFYRA